MKTKPSIFLIVNADDFGLVPSVSDGILEAHEKGIVSSTTMLVTRPVSRSLIRRAQEFEGLGIGIHLNMTLGNPVLASKRVRSLTDEKGRFRKMTSETLRKMKPWELEAEWTAQIRHFRKLTGQYPTHLDSHHHIHANLAIGKVFVRLAEKFRIPFRPSSPSFSKAKRARRWEKGILLPQSFLGNLDAAKHWTESTLTQTLKRLKPGIHELMCHPGRYSRSLSEISSFQRGRETELKALTSRKVLEIVKKRNIQLIHFGYLGPVSLRALRPGSGQAPRSNRVRGIATSNHD